MTKELLASQPPLLWPPIEEIERELQGQAIDASDEPGIEVPEERADAASPPLIPSFVIDRIQQKSAAASLSQELPLQPGNVLAVPLPGNSGSSHLNQVGFLLDCQPEHAQSANEWAGWLAAREADYAGPWDVLLETRDEPHDLSVAMVQAWNRTCLRMPERPRVLARLDAERLQAIRAVSDEARQGIHPNAGLAIPGRMGLRETHDGHMVLTGRPYRKTSDPRLRYREIYAELARCLQEAHTSATQRTRTSPASVGLSERLLAWLSPKWLAPALGVSAVVMVVQTFVITNLIQEEEYTQVRSLKSGTQQYPEVLVVFSPDATEREMRELIGAVRGELAGGPGTLGVYRIALPDGNLTDSLQILRASGKVKSVEAGQ